MSKENWLGTCPMFSGGMALGALTMYFLDPERGRRRRTLCVDKMTGAANANNTSAPADRPLNANMSREEYERDKDYYEREARRLGRTVGRGADDLWLWSKTRAALAAADDIRDLTINVDVDNNVVTLTGTVANEAQKGRAEQVARGVEGVREVKNNLAVGRL